MYNILFVLTQKYYINTNRKYRSCLAFSLSLSLDCIFIQVCGCEIDGVQM